MLIVIILLLVIAARNTSVEVTVRPEQPAHWQPKHDIKYNRDGSINWDCIPLKDEKR